MVSCIHCIPKRTPPEVIDLCQVVGEVFLSYKNIHMFGINNKKHMIPIAYISIGCQWSPVFSLSLHLLRLRWTKLHRGSKRLECEARIVKYGRRRGKRTAAATTIIVFLHDISIGYSWSKTSRESTLLHSWCASHFLWSKVCLALFRGFRMWQNNVGNKKKQIETTYII